MSELETIEMKLRTTPTGGMAGEHSPYYRRLLSAGYKGFLQGTIGGAGLYGFFGVAIGALIALPVMLIPGVPIAAALALIPAMGGVGVIKGSSTFGNIGSMAAINAESADLTEQRRYLLDRYYDLPDGPEGDKQAEIIKQELTRQTVPEKGRHLFHWKTVIICAAIGAALALAFVIPGSPLAAAEILGHTALGTALHSMELAVGGAAVFHSMAIACGAAVGALAGVTAGVDRSYVRRWFDGTERLLHDDSYAKKALIARAQQVERIKNAAAVDDETKRIIERRGELHRDETLQIAPTEQATAPAMPSKGIASLDAPDTRIQSVSKQHRLADIQHAMDIPTI